MSSTIPTTTQQLVATLLAPLKKDLLALTESPSVGTLEEQGVELPGEEIAAVLNAEPQLIGLVAQHILGAIDHATATVPATSTPTQAPGASA